MKINVLTTFSGYDSQCLALDSIKEHHTDFDYDLVAWSEIDKNAITAHNLLYPQYADRNLGDITKVDWEKLRGTDIDLLTYSSPCQDISQAGKQMGLKEGSETRSALLWYVIDAIKVLKPKVLMQENVAALMSSKFADDFQKWKDRLAMYGYKRSYAAMLNSKDFGTIPQNRKRVIMISLRDDIDINFQFPKTRPLERKLADMLDDEADDKYYLSDESFEKFMQASDEFKNNPNYSAVIEKNDNINDRYDGFDDCVKPDSKKHMDCSMWKGLPLHITAPSGKVYDLSFTDDCKPQWTRTYVDIDGETHTYGIKFRIRKLTPRECFRLMGVPDNRIDQLLSTHLVLKKGSEDVKEQQIISNSQLYKMAGNSIVAYGFLDHILEKIYYPASNDVLTDHIGQGILVFDF